MTQKDIELLLKDLSARLSYGVIINVHDTFPWTVLPYFNMFLTPFDSISSFIEPIFKTKDKLIRRILKEDVEYLEFKPYLRPMSSMTEDERKKLDKCIRIYSYNIFHKLSVFCKAQDYLNSIHVDYLGLIEKGLALEAPEGMYNLNKK